MTKEDMMEVIAESLLKALVDKEANEYTFIAVDQDGEIINLKMTIQPMTEGKSFFQ